MFVRMNRRKTVSTNGWNQVVLESGERYDMSDNLAARLIASGDAREVRMKEVEVEPVAPDVVVQQPPTLETKKQDAAKEPAAPDEPAPAESADAPDAPEAPDVSPIETESASDESDKPVRVSPRKKRKPRRAAAKSKGDDE